MTIELEQSHLYAIAIAIAIILIALLIRIGVAIGRSNERKQWTELADVQPKNFIITEKGQFTVFSKQEWDQYGLIELADMTNPPTEQS